MTKKFAELRAQMSPESRQRAEQKANEMLAAINNPPKARKADSPSGHPTRYEKPIHS